MQLSTLLEPLRMDWSSPYGVIRTYVTFCSTTIHHDYRSHIITLEIFTRGFYVLGFDLTPDREANEEHISMPHQGIVRIEARFKQILPEPVTCILYAVPRTQWDRELQKCYSRMNTIEINSVLTVHVKFFQGVYPIDLLPATLI